MITAHRIPIAISSTHDQGDSIFFLRAAPLLATDAVSVHKITKVKGTYSRHISDDGHPSTSDQSSRSIGRLPGRTVTVRLIQSRSPQEIYACLSRHEEDASGISISAGLTHLNKLCDRLAAHNQLGKEEKEAAEAVLQLASRMMVLEVALETPQTRCLSNTIWACAKLANTFSQNDSMVTIARDLASQLATTLANHPMAKESNSFDLSNTAYGLASLSLGHHMVWEGLLIPQSMVLAKRGVLQPQPLSIILWSLGKVQHRRLKVDPLPTLVTHALWLIDAEVEQSKHSSSMSLLPKPKHASILESPLVEKTRPIKNVVPGQDSSTIMPQFLSNICWAMAKLNYKDAAFLRAAANLFMVKESSALQPNIQNISSICWAFATLKVPCPDLFSRLKANVQALADSRKLGNQALSTLCWSYAKAGAYCPDLFSSLSGACLAEVTRFNSQDLVNIAWAFASTSHRDKPLMAAISRAALPLLPRLDPIEISQLLWSMATLNFSSERICNAVSELAEKQIDGCLHYEAPDNLPPLRRVEPGLSDELPLDFINKWRPWKMQAMTTVAWSFSVMRPYDARLFRAIYKGVSAQVDREHLKGIRYHYGFDPKASDIRHARQLYQAHLAHQLAWQTVKGSLDQSNLPPPTGLTDIPAEMPPKLLEMCKQAWMKNVSRSLHTSNSQLVIQASLEKLGYRCKSEFVLNHLLSVDILLHHPKGIDMVIEVDGPQHFANDGSPLGEHHLRNRLIRSLGYPLIIVRVVEWGKLEEDRKLEFLRDKVEEVVLETIQSSDLSSALKKKRFHRTQNPRRRRTAVYLQ